MCATDDFLEQFVEDAIASRGSAAATLRLLMARVEGCVPDGIATLSITAEGGAVTRTYHSSNDARDLSKEWLAGLAAGAVEGAEPDRSAVVSIPALLGSRWEALRARSREARVAELFTADLRLHPGAGSGEVIVFSRAAARQRTVAVAMADRLARLARLVLSRCALPPAAARPAPGVQRSLFEPRDQAVFKPIAASAAVARSPTLAASRPRAMIVEDDRAVGEVARRIVSREGYEVTLVLDPNDALRALDADPSSFGLLLLDLTLPGFDGGELLSRARRLGVTAPAMIISGLGERHARAACAGVKVDSFVSKPFSPAGLRAAMERVRRDVDAG